MSCDSSICSECGNDTFRYERVLHNYLLEDREPIPIRPIPKILKAPHYDPSLMKNQRILRNCVVSIRNIYVAYCLLNRKGLEYLVEIHRGKEKAVIKAGGYPYCDGEYIASEHFDDPDILYPPRNREFNKKVHKIVAKIKDLANILRSMWLKISSFEEINPKDIAFKQWTWEAIEFFFEKFYRSFLNESRILDYLASSLMHSSNFTKQQRCMQTWCEQRGIKDEDLNLIQRLLQEVGVKEPET